ncbi:PadR family transcriptional regulator [Sporosarcina sp. FSL W7-1349]|uniref:PadR family transcriptional regulator n=1 Tax=Sporosarcina sp. FSL W7-1349 TaxID=2921561 RepID=UPI0030F9B5CA
MRRRRGFVQTAVLHLLQEEAMHGYQIMKELEERSDGAYSASAGTIYPALQELLDQELIVLDTSSPKKIYSLSEAGEKRLADMNGDFGADHFWEHWNEKMKWRNSEEFTLLKTAIGNYEKELRKTMKKARGSEEDIRELIAFIDEMTERLQQLGKHKE